MEFRLFFFLCGCLMSFDGSILGILCGYFGDLELRYRLLWFWVFRWVLPRDLPMGLGGFRVEV